MSEPDLGGGPMPIIHENGAIDWGESRYEPWPLLTIAPRYDQRLTEEIMWAKPGDRFWKFTARIPNHVLCQIRKFPCFNWSLLELVASSPEHGIDLVKACPALAVLIAQNKQLHFPSGANCFTGLSETNWKRVLTELGLPPERGVLNILKKVPAEHCIEETVSALSKIIAKRHPRMPVLSHVARITRDTVALITCHEEIVTPKLLIDASASGFDEQPITEQINSIRCYLVAHRKGVVWPYSNLRAKELAVVESKLRWKYREEGSEILTPFPPPPVAGIPGRIEPLRTFGALIAEANSQHNCVCEYLGDILTGRSYIYSVNIEERATLALRLNRAADMWVVEDLRSVHDGEPSLASIRFVDRWLTENCAFEKPEN